MAEDDAIFKSAPPLLFGWLLQESQRDEELKCLNMATTRSTPRPSRETNFFQRGRSYKQQLRGGGQNLQWVHRWLPKAAPLPTTRRPVDKETGVQKDSEPFVVISPDIPLVTCMLIPKKYCANLMHSPIISTLTTMGVTPMAQRVTQSIDN